MKFPFSAHSIGHQIRERVAERERRYPIYTAFDVVIYWLICGGLFLLCVAIVGVILMQNSPLFASRALWLTRQILG